MPPNLRIERPSELLRERVVEAIRQAIIHGVFSPGQRLTERELIELTGVSRTSIREALRTLESRGLLENTPGQGLRVPTLTPVEVGHIYDVRAALEPAAVRLFVEHASDDELEALLAQVGRDNQPEDELWADRLTYDELLLRGARNPILEEMLGSLLTRIHSLRRVSLSMPGRRAASTDEFRRVVESIRERDAERAAHLTYERVLHAKEAALRVLAEGLPTMYPRAEPKASD